MNYTIWNLILLLNLCFLPVAFAETVLTGVVNLNTATESQLSLLPRIGPTKAQRIIDFRTKKPFTSVDQLLRVKGIGRKTFRTLKPNIAITGETNLVRSGHAKSKTEDDETARDDVSVNTLMPQTKINKNSSG